MQRAQFDESCTIKQHNDSDMRGNKVLTKETQSCEHYSGVKVQLKFQCCVLEGQFHA